MTEYRKSKPVVDVFVHGHRFSVPMTDANLPGNRKGGKVTASNKAVILFDNGTKKLSVNVSLSGGFGKYVQTHVKTDAGKEELPIGAIHDIAVRLSFPDAPSEKYVCLDGIKAGSKNTFPRWDGSAQLLGADYDLSANFSAVVTPNVTTVYDVNTGDRGNDLDADNARMAAKAAEMAKQLAADVKII